MASKMTPPVPPPALRRRQKRSQVVRACDWCRKHRVKCDSHYPCSNCMDRGKECSNEVMKVDTLPSAHREIERLRLRVQNLERELQEERGRTMAKDDQLRSSIISPPKLTSLVASEYGHSSSGRSWGGIYTSTARSPHKTWYGPSSLFYFIGRINNCLALTLRYSHSEDLMVLNTSSRMLDEPTAAHDDATKQRRVSLEENASKTGTYLSLTQEEYFLDLFWSSYHTSILPILNEAEFKQYYRSLWSASGNTRKSSALVDIVLAICMQYGMSLLPTLRRQAAANDQDATIAGRWYYRRSQTLLARELESPTISTLQCHLLCGIYLCSGSFQNMADSACGLAVRAAYMLGLHLDPPETMPRPEQEIRRRIWWVLCTLDSKIGMKLGRPFLLPHVTAPSLPGDSLELATQSGSDFAPLGDNLTWLSFNVHHSKLFRAARAVHSAFYGRDPPLREGQTTWDATQTVSSHAEFIVSSMTLMKDWAAAVPDVLKTQRQHNGVPFSTDGSSLEIETFVSPWLQRQRLLLELMYHHLSCNLYRPLVALGLTLRKSVAEETALKCAQHAITLTRITHQALSSTTILTGWYEAFQLQWSAAITLVGFVLSYPREPFSTEARQAISLSVAVFDIFANNFAVATSAAKIVRDLGDKVDFLKQHQATVTIPAGDKTVDSIIPPAQTSTPERNLSMSDFSTASTIEDGVLSSVDLDAVLMQDVFNMAFAVDEWDALDTLWPTTDPAVPQQYEL